MLVPFFMCLLVFVLFLCGETQKEKAYETLMGFRLDPN